MHAGTGYQLNQLAEAAELTRLRHETYLASRSALFAFHGQSDGDILAGLWSQYCGEVAQLRETLEDAKRIAASAALRVQQ